MRRLLLWIYRSEVDLTIERWVAHMFGWHTLACRGHQRCFDRVVEYGFESRFRGRWWRNPGAAS